MGHNNANTTLATASDIQSPPCIVDKSDRISHALELMDKHDVNCLLVTHEGVLTGFLTKQGIARIVGASDTVGVHDDVVKPSSALHVAKAMDERIITIPGETPVSEICALMKDAEVLAVVNEQLSGWITFDELAQVCRPPGYAGEIMEAPITISPHDRIVHIRRRMLDENAWWMLVVDGDKLVGIVTESDIAKAMSRFRDLVKPKYQDARVRKIVVDDIMITDVVSVRTNTSSEDVVALMRKKDVEGVPVLDFKDTLVGMITKNTIVRNL